MNGGKIKGESKISMIPIFQISENKSQPRKSFNREDIRYLARSIELNGILQPLMVRDVSPYEYELISGERRLRAAVMAGFSFVPCIVLHCNERQSAVYTLIENVQREDLSYFEQAEAIQKLIKEYGFSIEKASKQIGKSEVNIRNKLNLLNFSSEEREILISNSLSERYATVLMKIKDSNIRMTILNKVVENNLSLFDTEELVERLTVSENDRTNPRHRIVIKDIRLFYNTINKAVSTMRQSGINATEEKTETDEFVEYRIRITK
ncbi:MAG: ParB/RepB/Spo0J family partition protein [Clostridia bacterium]|nr:ParB/RepB/Spo0J family partition protein [Clostridia bacterium]